MAYLTPSAVKAAIGSKATAWDVDRIADLISRFETCVENHLGVAFEERTAVEDHNVSHNGVVVLDWPHLREVTAATVNNTDWTEDQLGDLTVTGSLSTVGGFGWGPVTVTYTHGRTEVPPALLDACVLFVKGRYNDLTNQRSPKVNDYDDPATGQTYSFGRTEPTGVPDADAVIAELQSERVPGIA